MMTLLNWVEEVFWSLKAQFEIKLLKKWVLTKRIVLLLERLIIRVEEKPLILLALKIIDINENQLFIRISQF